MADFNIEYMRDLPSPYEVLNMAVLPTQGLMRARILDPEADPFTVVGYDYMWGQRFEFSPSESERLKVIQVAIGDLSVDATLALILPEEDQEEMRTAHQELLDMHRDFQRQREQQVLEDKKAYARLGILMQAELTPDAVDLIKAEVRVEHPELHFPEVSEQPGEARE